MKITGTDRCILTASSREDLNKVDSKKIVIVTSGQPSANPRMVKEAIALSNAGNKVTVIYALLSPWADSFDQEIFNRSPAIDWVGAGYHMHKQSLGYKYARLRRKLSEKLIKVLPRIVAPEKAFVLFSQELFAKASAYKADIYIGHNLGALPAVVRLAEKYKAKCGFDAEDFHRGEAPDGSVLNRLAINIEEKYFPALDYFTAASPQINEQYVKLFPGIKNQCINNVFSKKYLNPNFIQVSGDPLKLWWFSQSIGMGRGLEDAIKAIGLLPNAPVTLSLLGNCSDEMRKYFTTLAAENNFTEGQLKFLPAVSEDEIHNKASQHHIGLALEVPESDNRKYCLTNKIFTYLLAGNAIIFSDTPAQKQFLNSYQACGLLYTSGDHQELAERLRLYIEDRQLLQLHRRHAFDLASTELNWEKESEHVISLVSTVLK